MNFNTLTEEQFDRMAKQLCFAWRTLNYISGETKSLGLVSPETLSICRMADERQTCIADTLGQDPDKEPQWPLVRKWQVGLMQYRTIGYQATVDVEAASMDEAKKKAFEVARKDAERLGPLICWTEGHESHDHERELDDDVWCCDEIND